MKCSECQLENPENMKFCGHCGSMLQKLCPVCETASPPEFMFCGKCGASLTRKEPEAASSQKIRDKETSIRSLSTESSMPDAERRQLTMMFCDLVGSTPLSGQLDPEELRDVLHEYQSVCAKVIRGLYGHIARYFGDGILAYFGYPIAHEDDAQRAVRAGLGIVEAMARLNKRLQQKRGIRLEVRLGIHTGLVVAGDMDENEQLESMAIIGETPNIAARLHSLAQPDTVVISSATRQLIAGFFDCRSLGSHSLEGVSQSVEVYHVLRESGARTRLDTAELTGLTPLVGRNQEVGLLLERWEQVKTGMGHVVLLCGEAGIGKSRMVKVLKEYVASDPQAWLTECHCSPYHQNSAFYPVVDLFERVILKFGREDSSEQKLSKVEGFLTQYGLPLDESVPLFATLLSIPLGDNYSPLNLTPQQQKQRTLQILLDVIMERASQQPVLFVVEDLHWADASSLEILSLLIDQCPTISILIVLTFRPEFIPPWSGRAYLSPITVNRLIPKQVSDMVERVAIKKLPDEVKDQIVAKTDGVPLFVEELTKMVIESDLLNEREDHYELTRSLPHLAIPATLHDSLMARLDRLATVKEVAQLGATIGREFSYELLQAISPLDAKTLQKALAQLVDAELLYPRGLPPQATYHFKHALIRDTAYESLLKSRRQRHHQQIAQALEEQFPDIAEVHPEILAQHYTAAGLNKQAIPYWYQAGQQAVQRSSAHVEAISHFNHGLELIKLIENLPMNFEQIQQELALLISLGSALIAIRGYTGSEVETTFTRARDLYQRLGETPQIFPALWGLFVFHFMRAELQTAHELAKRLLSMAESAQESAFLIEAHVDIGETLCELGELVPALEHLENSLALYDAQSDRSYTLFVRSSGVQCLGYMTFTLSYLGYMDRAEEKANEALALARKLNHPYSLGIALCYSTLLYCNLRMVNVVQEQLEALIAISSEHEFQFISSWGICLSGWLQVQQGMVEEGIAQMRKARSAVQTMGTDLYAPIYYVMLAEALGKKGQALEGLAIVDDGFDMVEKTENRVYEAELCRVKGELMLMQEADDIAVEACFQRAIEVARRQQAKFWELRATVCLSRLWQKQDKKEDARKMLQEICSWFTEGFDTKDLQEAKALLEELVL